MRSTLGLVAIASILAGCGSTTVVESGSSVDGSSTGAPPRTPSFAAPVAYANVGGKSVSQLRAIDIDGDGHLDLALVSKNTAVGVMRNAGDGTFEDAQWTDRVADHMVVTDLNGDGFGDVIVTGGTGQLLASYGAADGSLAEPIELLPSIAPESRLTTADMDGDGVPEVIVCSLYFVDIYRTGAGASVHQITANAVQKCAVGDVDGNGRPDLVAGDKSDTVGVWLSDANGQLAEPEVSTHYANKITDQTPSGLFTADLNGDGHADVISAFGGELLIHLANADGSLADPIHISPDLTSNNDSFYGTSLAFADLNGDGHLDAVMSDGGAQGTTVAILLGDGTGNLTQASIDLGLLPGAAADVTLGDFNGDGLLDIAVADDARTSILLNTSR